MTDLSNRQFLLAKRPSGDARREDFTYQEVPVSALADGQILVRSKYLSLDPAMRGWMNEGKSYIPAVELGEVMRAIGVGEVIESKNPKFAVGDHVQGRLGVQDYFAGEPKGFYKVDTNLAPLPLYLS
ncbi:NADP-dependent oxidoreductase, partial [Pseudomonas syringae]|nr:NADP-dependent oxidoreductase [Pseudomonas syringae]